MGTVVESTPKRKYLLKRSAYDHRDYKITFNHPDDSLPDSVDLRQKELPIYDQGQTNSCTSNSICHTCMYDIWKQDKIVLIPSRLFVYYNERMMDGTVNEDCGSTIKQSVKAVAKYGFVSEDKWNFDPNKIITKPPQELYDEAKNHIGREYYQVTQTVEQIKKAIAAGFYVNLGIAVYDSFESDEVSTTGVIPMPTASNVLRGYHAVCLCGYSQEKQCFLLMNSWSQSWCLNGCAWISYQYISDPKLAFDAWVLSKVQDTSNDKHITIKKI